MRHGSIWQRQIKLQVSILFYERFGYRYVYDKEKKEYYCIRCQYTGTEEDVLEKNELVRFRYKDAMKRFTKFDFD